MSNLIVIDFDDGKKAYESKISNMENVKYINYYNAISNLDKISVVELNKGCSYDSMLIMSPEISQLSRISRLISTNIIEELILDQLFHEKEIIIDFMKLKDISLTIRSITLKKKLDKIFKDLKDMGAIDISDLLGQRILKKQRADIRGQNIFITQKDISHIAKGGDLILNTYDKLTPLARDFVKSQSINIIRKPVGE